MAIPIAMQMREFGPVRPRMFVVRRVQADIEEQGIDQPFEVARIVQRAFWVLLAIWARNSAMRRPVGMRMLQVVCGQQPMQSVQLRNDDVEQTLDRIGDQYTAPKR